VVYAFAAWTVFVWANRIRNILDDSAADGTSGAGNPVDLVAAGVMVGLAVLVALAAWRGRPAWAVPALAVATVVTWAVRVPQVLSNPQWSVPFQVVHVGLAVVSIALAYGAWRSWRRSPASQSLSGAST
jgi:hypothetical protein